jgi:hypothetical protein
MAKKKESFFWTSYSDLMTSLFFIMLTLFVLVIVLLHKRMEATEKQLEEIKKVEASTKELGQSKNFAYKAAYKKYVLDVRCFFNETKYSLSDLQADTMSLRQAGQEIKEFLDRNKSNQYLLIIEGQASRNSVNLTDANYDWSFQRALTLMKFWKDICQIDFGANCEIQIAGRGDGRYNFGYTAGEGTDRFKELDATLMRERGNKERENQRFVIHIIPKNIIEDAERK